MRYELYTAADGWRWHLRASNGEIIADSGEAYQAKIDAQHGISLVQNSAHAPIVVMSDKEAGRKRHHEAETESHLVASDTTEASVTPAPDEQ